MSGKTTNVVDIRWVEPALDKFEPRLQAAALVLQRKAGAVLFRAGQKPTQMFYVLSGEAQMKRVTPSGAPVLLQRASRGFLAEASLTGATYHCDAVCRSQCDLLAFPIQTLREAIDRDEGTRWAWIGLLSAQSRQQRTRIERLGMKTVRERLLHLVHTDGVGGVYELAGTRMDLAAELAVSPEALYRELAALRADGTLLIEGPRLQWCDV